LLSDPGLAVSLELVEVVLSFFGVKAVYSSVDDRDMTISHHGFKLVCTQFLPPPVDLAIDHCFDHQSLVTTHAHWHIGSKLSSPDSQGFACKQLPTRHLGDETESKRSKVSARNQQSPVAAHGHLACT